MTISDCPHNGLGGTRVSNSQLSLEASSSTVERCRNSHTCDSHVHAALSAVSHCEAEEAQDDEQQDEGPQMSGVHVARRGDQKLDYFNKDGNDSGNEGEDDDDSGDDSVDGGEDEEEEEHRPAIRVATVPIDPRFPGFNQARACYTRYNEFYKCKAQKDESDPECVFYQRAYRSLCPGEWVESWNEQREEGKWFGKY